MYTIFISLCGAALFCNTLTQAADSFGVNEALAPNVAAFPVIKETSQATPSFTVSAEAPDDLIYLPEDVEASPSASPTQRNQTSPPQVTDAELKPSPYFGENAAAEPESSDLNTFNTSSVYAPSVLVSSQTSTTSTMIYQTAPSESQASVTHTENADTAATTTDDRNYSSNLRTEDEHPSTLSVTTTSQGIDTSASSSYTFTTAYNYTTSAQLSPSTSLSSASIPETTIASSNSSYVPTPTTVSSALNTAPSSETNTGLFNSSTSLSANSSIPLSTASSSESITVISSSTLTSSLWPISTTDSSSNLISEPASNTSPSSSMYLPSATLTSSTRGLNTSIPSVTSTKSYNPISTGTSLIPGNSSVTALPDSSTNTPFSPTGTAVYTSSSLSPISGNSTTSISPGSSPITVPYQSSTWLPNSTYTASPSNSTSVGSPSQTETSVTSSAPTKVMPTATNTGSTFIPSSIIAQTSSTYSTGYTTTTSTGIPSSLPKIVQNPLGSSSPAQPEDTSEVQIGFQWALNYPFVVGHPLSTSQIFTYLPIGVADGIGLKPEQIVVKSLFPLDTTAELNYITTVARMFIPSSMVDTLRIDLGIAASPIYQNEDDSVRTLMNFINPAIPFFPGTVMEHGALPTKTSTQSTMPSSSNAGVFNADAQQPQSASARGTTAGIALAACGGAAAYGAAMFLLARRYKHRQQQTLRPNSPDTTNSSIESAESPIENGNEGTLMSGGCMSPSHDRNSGGSGRTGYSARTAQISGPMMAENSLGWN